MAKSYEAFYEGGFSSFDPDYGNFVGYRMSAAELGFPGSPQTANQLGEAVNAMKQGVKTFEVTMLQGDMAETIPKQHFEEMRALMKLSGVKPSVHGPMIDAAGFDEKGNWGGEFGQADAERRMFDTIEKAAMLDSKGNVPVVFHSSAGAPGAEWRPGEKEGEMVMKGAAVIDKETGQAQAVKEHRTYYLDTSKEDFELGKKDLDKGGSLMTVEQAIRSRNETDWDDRLKGVVVDKMKADRAMGSLWQMAEGLELTNMAYETEEERAQFDAAFRNEDSEAIRVLNNEASKADILLDNNNLSFRALFDRAYKYGSDVQREELKKISDAWKAENEAEKKEMKERGINPFLLRKNRAERQDRYFNVFNDITSTRGVKKGEKVVADERYGAPKVFQESNEFAMDKAAETFGNLAKRSYDKLGEDKAPVLAIEPFHSEAGLSATKDMKILVEKARENFANQLVKEKGMNKKKAEKVAESKIGVTWDVGHINMIKKYGFTDKDIVKQTKDIAPMVKHVHLTDNFGFADTHLAPGMGNVPMKDILETLEKEGDVEGVRKIVESGAFVQHFKKSPHGLTMAAFGSPIYGMKMGAGWNQAMDVSGSYFGGYGTLNPQTHHQYFGAGFTTMPVELGGQQAGGQSRFGGTPMA
jgi:sugar phosphate isomerase/epimerase